MREIRSHTHSHTVGVGVGVGEGPKKSHNTQNFHTDSHSHLRILSITVNYKVSKDARLGPRAWRAEGKNSAELGLIVPAFFQAIFLNTKANEIIYADFRQGIVWQDLKAKGFHDVWQVIFFVMIYKCISANSPEACRESSVVSLSVSEEARLGPRA